jgi:succinoglycan biosynthesis transport protein ExoP
MDLENTMLQYRTPLLQLEENGSTRDGPVSAELSLADVLNMVIGFIRRQFLIILSVVPLTVGLGIIYLRTTPPLYTAEAKILIDTGKVQISNQPVFGDGPVNLAIVDSQIEILKSDNFALSLIKKLHLTQDPEFANPNQGLFSRTLNRLLNRFGSKATKKESDPDSQERALAVFIKRLAVNHVAATYIIDIQFQSTNPGRAAELANAVAEAFVRDQIEARYETIGRAAGWLQDRLTELRVQASAAEHAVVDYKTKHNIVDTGGRLINEQQLNEINTALIKARADMVEAKARLDRVSQIVSNNDLDPSAVEVATVADALHNEIIIKLRQQYLELAQRESLFSNRLGRDHLAVVNIRNQMRETRRSIFDEFRRIAGAYKSEYDIAKERENSLQASLAATVAGSQSTNAAQIELRQLESSAQSYRALYDSFQKRYTDFAQQQSFPLTEAQVTRALPPSASSSPKYVKILAMATAGGFAIGFAMALLREIADRVFRTSKQVETRLRTECVAMLPMLKPARKDAFHVNKKNVTSGAATRVVAPNRNLCRHVVDSPLSQFTEAIRAIKLTIDIGSGVKSSKVIGITSSLPDEGKSTISASIAQLCAQSGARVILVDCDLRKRSLSYDLAPNATVGMLEVITEVAKFDEVVWSDPSTKLAFLPVVVESRLAHTSEILASAAMKGLFNRLREKYDYVIVDLSPLAPVVDVRAAAHLLDSFLLVLEWGKTKIDVVEHALNTSRGVYDKLLGVIMNKVDFARLGRYEYSTYYSRYGYYVE